MGIFFLFYEREIMNLLESVRNHWFVGILIISASCIGVTWKVLDELLVKPRDSEIKELKYKISTLENSFKNMQFDKDLIETCKKINSIAIHSKKGKTDQRGIQLIKYLRNKGCISTGIVAVSQNLKFSELRYFHKSDLYDVKNIRDLLDVNLQTNLTLNFVSEFSHKAKKGYFEIWLK